MAATSSTLLVGNGFISAADFDASKLSVANVKVNVKSKAKSIDLLYAGQPLVIRAPKMNVPLIWSSPDEPDSKVSVELSFRDMETTPALQQLHDALLAFDEKIKQEAAANSEAWFKKQMPIEALNFMFSPTVKPPNDPKYSATVKAKLFKDKKTDSFACTVFDEKKQLVTNFDVSQLKGASVMSLIQCTGIWIAGPKFGTTWKLVQMRMYPRTKTARAERTIDLNAAVPGASVDVAALTYSAPISMPGGGKVIYLNSNDGPFVFETPEMHCPFGASVWQDDKGSKFSLDLAFRDADTNPAIKAFQDVIAQLDARVKADAQSNGWFKSACIYSPILRQNNPAYPANMKLNIPSEGDQLRVEVVNANNEPVVLGINTLQVLKGGKASAVVQCGGVWQNGSRFGVSFKVLKLKVRPSVDTMSYNMVDDDDDDMAAAEVHDGAADPLLEDV